MQNIFGEKLKPGQVPKRSEKGSRCLFDRLATEEELNSPEWFHGFSIGSVPESHRQRVIDSFKKQGSGDKPDKPEK